MSLSTVLVNTFIPLSPLKIYKLLKYLRLVQKRDVATIDRLEADFFHPDFVCHGGGKGRISGTYHGWKEYRDKIILGEVSTPGELLSITTNKARVNLMTRLSGERAGKTLDLEVMFMYRFLQGRLVEQRSVPFDDEAWDRFWA